MNFPFFLVRPLYEIPLDFVNMFLEFFGNANVLHKVIEDTVQRRFGKNGSTYHVKEP